MRLRERRLRSEARTRGAAIERRDERQFNDARVEMWSIMNDDLNHDDDALRMYEATRGSVMRANAAVMGGEWA